MLTVTVGTDVVTLDSSVLPGWGAPVWRDEFDGDLSKWNVRTTGTEAQDTDGYFAPGMAFIQNGMLVMRTQRTSPVKVGTKAASYATCYLDTIGKQSQRYGRWEIRLKALEPMHSRGIWPAFWLRDDTSGGEVDVYEAVGTPCAHPSSYPNDGSGVSSTFYAKTGAGTSGVDRTGGNVYRIPVKPFWDFHVYACEWTPKGIATFYDGVKQLEVTADTAVGRAILAGFTGKANMRLDKFVGTDWAGRPNTTDTRDTDDMLVDYVRVWAYTP
jgi:beta-glucanase (GH16 family)